MRIDVIAHAAAGPFAAACAVLAFAGVAKIRRPDGVGPAAAALGLPSSATVVRALGFAEVAAAVAGLAIGGPAAGAVAALYVALAAAAWRLSVRAPGTACGCLGPTDAPVSTTHAVMNVAAGIAAALAVGAGSPLAAAGPSSWSRVAYVLLVGCCAWLATVVFDALPALVAAREGTTR